MGPVAQVANDMARRGMIVTPLVAAPIALFAGWEVGVSIGYAALIVIINFLLAAHFLSWAARISLALIPSVALGGYALRLGLVFLAVWLVKDFSWVRIIPLGITIIATHLGLLVWELRYVSATFAHPGLKPRSTSESQRQRRGRAGNALKPGKQPKPAAGFRPREKFKSPSF